MKNFVQPGNVVTLPAPVGGIVSGYPLLVGSLFGVAAYTAVAGDDVEVALEGVYTLPKATGALAAGQKVYWDAANKVVTGTAGSNAAVGAAVVAAGSSAVSVRVRLDGKSV